MATNKLILLGKNRSIFFIHVFSVAGKSLNYSSKERSIALTKTGCWEALISQVWGSARFFPEAVREGVSIMALLLICIPRRGGQHCISKEDMGQHLFEPVTFAFIMKNPSSINQLKFQTHINCPLSLCLRAEDIAAGTGKIKTELPISREVTEFI